MTGKTYGNMKGRILKIPNRVSVEISGEILLSLKEFPIGLGKTSENPKTKTESNLRKNVKKIRRKHLKETPKEFGGKTWINLLGLFQVTIMGKLWEILQREWHEDSMEEFLDQSVKKTREYCGPCPGKNSWNNFRINIWKNSGKDARNKGEWKFRNNFKKILKRISEEFSEVFWNKSLK